MVYFPMKQGSLFACANDDSRYMAIQTRGVRRGDRGVGAGMESLEHGAIKCLADMCARDGVKALIGR